MIGKEIGKYRVTEQIGEGGMGTVYKGTHSLIGRHAAIKVLLPELSHNQEIVNRFFNEAKATTAIRHPGIVEIFDFGYIEDTGAAYIVMEFLHGEPLTSRMQRKGTLASEDALSIIRQMAGALSAAHDKGIIHRDLKPDNVFLVSDPEVTGGERIKILDFGIAKLTDDGAPASIKTRTGAVMGTPSYMAPEQCRGAGGVDARSDLYSLGCILFEMMTGRLVFPGEGAGEVLAAHIHVAAPSPRSIEPSIPVAVEALIMRLLAKEPGDRPASAMQLISEIDSLGYSAFRAATSHPMPVATAPTMSGEHTTLGGAAGAVSMHPGQTMPPQAGGKKWLAPALIGALLVGGAAGAFVVLRGDKHDHGEHSPTPIAAAGSPAERPTAKLPTPAKADPARSGLTHDAEAPGTEAPDTEAPDTNPPVRKSGGLLSAGTLKMPTLTPPTLSGTKAAPTNTQPTSAATTPPVVPPINVAPPVVPPINVAPPVVPPVTTKPPVVPSITPPTPATATPVEFEVMITSVPSGAAVHKGRQALGKTPYAYRFKAGKGTLRLQLKKRGYRTARLSFSANKGGTKNVRLKKTRHRGNNSGGTTSIRDLDDD